MLSEMLLFLCLLKLDGKQIGDELIIRLCGEIAEEFPSVDTIPDIIKNRHYEKVETDDFWKVVE